jgi:preprotein translocase subunit SecD
MKFKLQFGVFLLLLAFLGAYLEEATVPNQQIVIQFSDANISSTDAGNTIEIVKKQLQSIGVTHIQIGQHQDGKLKITYYSDADVERIQNILSTEKDFKFAYGADQNNSNDFPENRNVKDYELNISEIQNSGETSCDFEGIQITELNQKSDCFYNPKVNVSSSLLNTEHSNNRVKVAIHVNDGIAIDCITYKIPEVRAGPCKGEYLI